MPRFVRGARWAGLCALALLAAAGTPLSGRTPAIELLDSPAGAGSAQPQLSVSSRGALLSWIERAGTTAVLKFAERDGRGWTAPRIVASGADWFVNWADVPSVMRLSDGTLAAHWLQKSGPDTYAYDVRLAYSRDDGRTWSTPFTPHHDGTQTEHGFASLVEMPGGGLGLVWLDGRAMAGAAHGASGGGAMTVRFGTFDANWKQTSDVLLDPRVCECCPTSLAVTADGPIAAFRDRSEAEVRDISVSRLVQGTWTEPRAVHDDGWTIPACPVNGPMLSANGRRVAIAWFTVKNDQGRALLAFSSDAGRTFGPPVRLDDAGALGRVDVALFSDGSALASWIEFANGRAQFRARRVEPSGTLSPAITVAGIEGSRTSGYPRMARHGSEVVFAWTASANGELRVQTAVARFEGAESAGER